MKRMVYEGWHKIEERTVEMKGQIVKREILHLKDAVAAITTDKEGRIALVSQYRPALGKSILEIPAGVVDKSLSLEKIIIEELEEECEINRRDIVSLQKTTPAGYHMVSGSSPAYITMFRAKVKCLKDPAYEVNDADVDYVLWLTFEQFEKKILSGEIVDAKTVFAYHVLKGEN